MGKCLFSQLHEDVDNDNLILFGMIKLSAPVAISNPKYFEFSKNWIEDFGGIRFYINDSEVPFDNIPSGYNSNVKITAEANGYILLNKYNSNGNLGSPLKIEYGIDDYCPITGINVCSNYCKTEGIHSNNVAKYSIFSADDNVGNYASVLNSFPNIKSIKVVYFNATVFGGQLSDVANAEKLYTISDYGTNRTVTGWNSSSLRPSSYPIISINAGNGEPTIWFSQSAAKNFLINMASCQVSSEDTLKKIHIQGYNSSDPEVAAAISTLASKGYTVG